MSNLSDLRHELRVAIDLSPEKEMKDAEISDRGNAICEIQ